MARDGEVETCGLGERLGVVRNTVGILVEARSGFTEFQSL
jgi:hypothetical protein